MQITYALYGGGVLMNGVAEISILGFNPEGNPVTCRVPAGKLLNTVTQLSDKFKPATRATAIYFYTNEHFVLWTVVDDKLKVFHDAIPLDKCWTAIDEIGNFEPVNLRQAA